MPLEVPTARATSDSMGQKAKAKGIASILVALAKVMAFFLL